MTINYDPTPPDIALEEHRMNLGLVGKLIGSGDQARFSITLIIMIILLVLGIINTFIGSEELPPLVFWNLIFPVLTLGLGFIFGQKTS